MNLPGKLLLKRGDLLISRDLVWGLETSLSALNLTRLNDAGTSAALITRHLFEGRRVRSLHLDQLASGEERLVVSHGFQYSNWGWGIHQAEDGEDPYLDRVAIFNLSTLDLLGHGLA